MISMDYPPTPGGISAHVYELSRALRKAGNRVTVLTRLKDKQPVHSTEDSIDIYRVQLKYMALIYGLQITKFVKRLLPKLKPDIIHIHGMMPLEWYDIDHIPLAYTNHTSGYLKRIKKGGMRRMAMLKRHFKKVDLFLAPSKELLQIPFSIRAEKVFIPNGVDGQKFLANPDKRATIRKDLGFTDDDIVAIITRRLVDKNGVIYLARATKYLQDNKLKFIIIGDGPERAAVEHEFTSHCGQRALFLGNKTHDEIVDYYSGADFSILPSLMEATSISGLEAMAASLPLVGTAVGGIPELIQDEKNGYLCKPADPEDLAKKINLLLNGDIQALGHQSREMIEENFDWTTIAQKTIMTYKKALQ